jgi:outer membrane protein assembly factor BamE (lipoprotein component of BamABCDE complex)
VRLLSPGQGPSELDPSVLRRVSALLLVLALVSTACSTTGRRFSPDLVPFIERGKSTQQDVRRWFGEPASVRVRGSGVSAWTYMYEERKRGDTRTITRLISWIGGLFGHFWWMPPFGVSYEVVTRHRLVVFFDEEGVATEYEYSREEVPITQVS